MPLIRFFTTHFGLKIVAVMIAIILWTIVLLSKKETLTKDVPIEFTTTEDLIPANDLPKTVSVVFSGPKALLRGMQDRREETIRVTLPNKAPGFLTYKLKLDDLKKQLSSIAMIDIVSSNPSSIVIQLDKLATKIVPIRVQLQGVPQEGYQVVTSQATPDQVTISGARGRISRVDEVYTTPVDLSTVVGSFEETLKLLPPIEDVQVQATEAQVKLHLQAVSPNYKIHNIEINVISLYKHKMKDQSATVYIRAKKDQLKNLDQSKVFAEVDLTGKAKGTYSVKLKIKVPEGIGVVKVVPESVKVTLY